MTDKADTTGAPEIVAGKAGTNVVTRAGAA